ncbi:MULTISPECIES: HlyD family secretion protein [Chryseobacterium]|jgi:membrane fusion protein (multidrug efflux system)|uniref:HlyD family secretion protein n=1 Tax=Chryseobacterium rhizosphaerae TaxID=395937 RepID=A0AAE4C433_9FLAO|nr:MULTISPECIES: HlyD family secretion protein [Chryseobacterium]MBL3548957.1 HlyD family secretion protein [Chryseobacterium sp. KMC2]MDC8101249.1 HlyD family secretion protein [Chryseobacterium rhizosphaerae]MDR6529186.1 membrane fusion protein (multidrug efflux system) [Chryseobacterium rhizosphaerae]MDR6545469.1 membrane fusion protein (multidrug efflux system) [Chryseobacterium rhizosphaerae]REC75250.1 HlyD family secretion protein [Chryseobacterium rhizosphaerae]
MENNNTQAVEPKKKKSLVFPIILAAVVIGGGIYGYRAFTYGQYHEETDDAQIASNMTPVISKISGYITEVKVKDNQFVKKGDTLVILDNRDQKMALEQAQAALSTAKSNISNAEATTTATSKNISSSEAAVVTANAQIEAAKVNVWKTSQDLKRYANLVKDHSITEQQYEQALAAKQSADKQLQVLVDQRNQIAQQTNIASSQTAASSQQISVAGSVAKQREVDVENAKLNLSYTVILAAEDGYVGKVPTQVGQYLQAGAQLFALVKNDQKWVVANFKETQVDKMVEGQKVKIEIDAFPDKEFEGVVSSFSPATGATFSILPPDNASGNFVKVVQRLPIKIDFVNLDKNIAKRLRTGMNVKAEVSLK